MFKIAVVICSFNCLIALEAKCHPSNGSNFRPPFVGIMFFIRNFQTWNEGGRVITIIHYSYLIGSLIEVNNSYIATG